MKLTPSIARRFVIDRLGIVGVLATLVAFAAATLPAAVAPTAHRDAELRYARLDPAAVLGGHDGLMPPSERGQPDGWDRDERNRRRRSRDTERRDPRRETDRSRADDRG